VDRSEPAWVGNRVQRRASSKRWRRLIEEGRTPDADAMVLANSLRRFELEANKVLR